MVLIFPPEIDKLNEEIKPYENCENVPPEIENKRKIVSAWIEEQFRLEEECCRVKNHPYQGGFCVEKRELL